MFSSTFSFPNHENDAETLIISRTSFRLLRFLSTHGAPNCCGFGVQKDLARNTLQDWRFLVDELTHLCPYEGKVLWSGRLPNLSYRRILIGMGAASKPLTSS